MGNKNLAWLGYELVLLLGLIVLFLVGITFERNDDIMVIAMLRGDLAGGQVDSLQPFRFLLFIYEGLALIYAKYPDIPWYSLFMAVCLWVISRDAFRLLKNFLPASWAMLFTFLLVFRLYQSLSFTKVAMGLALLALLAHMLSESRQTRWGWVFLLLKLMVAAAIRLESIYLVLPLFVFVGFVHFVLQRNRSLMFSYLGVLALIAVSVGGIMLVQPQDTRFNATVKLFTNIVDYGACKLTDTDSTYQELAQISRFNFMPYRDLPSARWDEVNTKLCANPEKQNLSWLGPFVRETRHWLILLTLLLGGAMLLIRGWVQRLSLVGAFMGVIVVSFVLVPYFTKYDNRVFEFITTCLLIILTIWCLSVSRRRNWKLKKPVMTLIYVGCLLLGGGLLVKASKSANNTNEKLQANVLPKLPERNATLLLLDISTIAGSGLLFQESSLTLAQLSSQAILLHGWPTLISVYSANLAVHTGQNFNSCLVTSLLERTPTYLQIRPEWRSQWMAYYERLCGVSITANAVSEAPGSAVYRLKKATNHSEPTVSAF